MKAAKEKLLIYQIGSLGDTIIAMPCYREIARRHPDAERFLLTNFPRNSKMVQAEALLFPCGLIHGSVEYPMPLRGLKNMIHLFRKLRALKIDLLYYLTPEGRVKNLIRHTVFFKLCGVKKIRAAPWSKDLRFPREVVPDTLWESEASRLLRTLDPSRPPGAPEPSDRVLDLTVAEQTKAQELLSELPAGTKFLTLSVGGKIPLNNWGDENWGAVLAQLSREMPQLGLVLVGSADERERNDRLAQRWAGPTLNSCGRLTPRETAALIQRAEAFVGHDTGTLHLAAAVGTKIVGVYSARNKPGKWYSDRPGDRFFYHKPPCFGCELELASACPNGLLCMTSHRPEEVAAATRARIEE